MAVPAKRFRGSGDLDGSGVQGGFGSRGSGFIGFTVGV